MSGVIGNQCQCQGLGASDVMSVMWAPWAWDIMPAIITITDIWADIGAKSETENLGESEFSANITSVSFLFRMKKTDVYFEWNAHSLTLNLTTEYSGGNGWGGKKEGNVMPLDLNWFSCFRNLVSYFQIMMMRNSGSHDKPNGVMDITFWRGGKFS